ncbi:MAG: T9SS type A sorting domain-containing protein [Pseudarcicella sp.]|nr:T9SS type A sorting domain-containing protein [Pseudarcicella sp.]
MRKILLHLLFLSLIISSGRTFGQTLTYDVPQTFDDPQFPTHAGTATPVTLTPWGDFLYKRCNNQSGYDPTFTGLNATTKGVQLQSNNTNKGILVLPAMPNGIGKITFRYKNNAVNGSNRILNVYNNISDTILTTPVTTFESIAYPIQLNADQWKEGTIDINNPSPTNRITFVISFGNFIIDNLTVTPASNVPVATLVISPQSLSFIQTSPATASPSKSFTVSGSTLSADVVLTAPDKFEISLDSLTGFVKTLTLAKTGTDLASKKVFARSNGSDLGAFNGALSIVSGTTSKNLNLLSANPISFFYKGTGKLNKVSSWGKNADGSGDAPLNFITPAQLFTITNSISVVNDSVWTVAGANSKIIIGSSSQPAVKLSTSAPLSASGPYANIVGTIEIAAASSGSNTLVLEDTRNLPTFGMLAASSTVQIRATPLNNLAGTVTFGNLVVSNGARFTVANKPSVATSILVEENSTLNLNGATNYFIMAPTAKADIKGTFVNRSNVFSSINTPVIGDDLGGGIQFTGSSAAGLKLFPTSLIEFPRANVALAPQTIDSRTDYAKIKVSGFTKVLTGNVTLSDSLLLPSGTSSTKVILAGFNLKAKAVSASNGTSYIVTNGGGTFSLPSSGANNITTFPIGGIVDTDTLYNPAILTHNGSANTFAASVSKGTICKAAEVKSLKKAWNITPTTALKAGENVEVKLQWNEKDQNAEFVNAQSAIIHCPTVGAVADLAGIKGAPVAGSLAGTYVHTLSGVTSLSPFGITSDVPVISAPRIAVNRTICKGQKITVGGVDYTTPQVDKQIDLVKKAGGDSLILFNLTVKETNFDLTKTICFGSNLKVGDSTFTKTGNYSVKISRANACDSIVAVKLTVLAQQQATPINRTICFGQTFAFDGKTLTTAGLYTATFRNKNGCDSVVNLTLTIAPELKATVASDNKTLTAQETAGNTYQWVSCAANGTNVTGATAKTFTPTIGGSYKVVITNGTCTATSTCSEIKIVTGNEVVIELAKNVLVNPNPIVSNGKLTISYPSNEQVNALSVLGMNGQFISNLKVVKEASNKVSAILPSMEKGNYLMNIKFKKGTVVKKISVK